MSTRRLTIAAWSVAAVTTALGLACILLEAVGPGPAASSADPEASAGGVGFVAIQVVMAVAFAILGAVVVSRQPRNPVGWLMVLIGFFFMYIALSNELYLQVVLNTGETPGIVAYALWAGNWAWVFAILPGFTFLPLLFPTGRPLTARWRAVTWFAAAALALAFVGSAFKAGPLDGTKAVENPVGIDSPVIGIIEGIAAFCLFPALLVSIPSLILRFRRSSGPEREQIKWVASAALLLPITAAVGTAVGNDYTWPLILVAMLVMAIAITVAMLRYRLYDIDVVINRALVYGSLTATLAGRVRRQRAAAPAGAEWPHRGLGACGRGVHAGGRGAVPARPWADPEGGGPSLLPQPLRRRTRTIEAFGARLRDEVDLTMLSADLQAVVVETMRPDHVSLWLRAPGVSR